jgi:MYXO-CTERM domain-containing protein
MSRRYFTFVIIHALAVVTALAVLAAAPGPALANGRFPKTVNVRIQPNDDQVILVPSTFGLLISRDRGTSFEWVCEEAIGYGGSFDPDYAIAADGSIFATTFEGLRVTRDGGCVWQAAGDLSTEEYFADVEIGPDGAVWAATASAAQANHLYMSTDNGQSFVAQDAGLPQVWWRSLKIAPTDAQRLYLTGYRVAEALPDGGTVPPTAVFFRSDDHGVTWNELALATIEFGTQPWFRVEAVAEDNPDVLLGRAQGANNALGDILYRSTDGGVSFTEVLRTEDMIRAVVIRHNGEFVAGTLSDGVHRSADGGNNWTRTEDPDMCCVGEDSAGMMYACGANWEPDFFALGKSMDGSTWDKVVRFSEIAGAYSCPSGTVQRDVCEAKRWPAMCEMFGCNRVLDAAPTPDARPGGGGGRGCCQSADGPTDSLVLGLLVGLWLLGISRRRHYCPTL